MKTFRSRVVDTPITLASNVAVLDGTGGESISSWEDRHGLYPEHAVLELTNNGAAEVTVGNEATGPAVLLAAAGKTVGLLFNGIEVVVPAGETIVSDCPPGAAAKGQLWSVRAALASGATVNVTVRVKPKQLVEV